MLEYSLDFKSLKVFTISKEKYLPNPTTEPKPESKTELEPEPNMMPKPESKTELELEPNMMPNIELEPEPNMMLNIELEQNPDPEMNLDIELTSDSKMEPNLDQEPKTEPETKPKPKSSSKVLIEKEIKLTNVNERNILNASTRFTSSLDILALFSNSVAKKASSPMFLTVEKVT
ncbi:hypothetical protein DSO57_1008363 [Entomophthora muscae]|uniref:Uncharacterized protein n=1 Tax=Entomophthora muscae TaxID=34485 RepID=A0ACC2RY67_9FUNG|nr:hypothetical protein DSO57_1008363 [Entomophthora muscae]